MIECVVLQPCHPFGRALVVFTLESNVEVSWTSFTFLCKDTSFRNGFHFVLFNLRWSICKRNQAKSSKIFV